MTLLNSMAGREFINAALCTWEAMLGMRQYVPALDRRWQEEGTVAMRYEAIELGFKIERAYNKMPTAEQDTFDTYDWDFVPSKVRAYYEEGKEP